MMQRINRSLAPQCLTAPEEEETQTQGKAINDKEKNTLETVPSAKAAQSGKQKNRRQHHNNNKKTTQHPDPQSGQAQPHSNGSGGNRSPPRAFPAEQKQPLRSDRRPSVPVRTDSLLGPVPQPYVPVNSPRLPCLGPFNYPPPPLNCRFIPPPPPFGPMVAPPQFWQQGHRLSRPQFVPRNAPQPRTSSPIPGPRHYLHYEEDFARWIERLEVGSRNPRRSPPIGPAVENHNNDVRHQTPLNAPPCLPPGGDTVVVQVGFLPNGCYGPILPPVFQCPAPAYPGYMYPAPVQGPVGMPMLLGCPLSETHF